MSDDLIHDEIRQENAENSVDALRAALADMTEKRDLWCKAAMSSENERQIYHHVLTMIGNGDFDYLKDAMNEARSALSSAQRGQE